MLAQRAHQNVGWRWIVASAAAMGKAAWPSRCLAPQLVPSRTPSERTFKQASRHRHGRPQRQALHPSQVAGATIYLHRKASELGELFKAVLAWAKRTSWRARDGRVRRAAVGDQSSPALKRYEQAWTDHFQCSSLGKACVLACAGAGQVRSPHLEVAQPCPQRDIIKLGRSIFKVRWPSRECPDRQPFSLARS